MRTTLLVLILISVFTGISFAQGGWVRKHDLDTGGLAHAVGDTANGKLYLFGGLNHLSIIVSNTWEYNPRADKWKRKSNMPSEREAGFCKTVNNKIYLGLGMGAAGTGNYLLMYDPVADTFGRKTDFPGRARAFPVSYTINGKIYVGLGKANSGSPVYLNDFYEYDPSTDTWTSKATFPALPRYGCGYFTVNGKAYVTEGVGITSTGYDTTYEYNPSTDTWTLKTPFSISSGLLLYEGFSVDTAGYYLTGTLLWEYYPSVHTWNAKPNFPGSNRDGAVAYSLPHTAYMIGGEYSDVLNDTWKYNPDCPVDFSNQVSLSGTKSIFCGTSTIDTLKGDSVGYSTVAYKWLSSSDSINYTAILGGDSMRLKKRTFTQTTYLKRVVTLTTGCLDTSGSIAVRIVPFKKAVIDTLTHTHLCAGDTALLTSNDTFKKKWYYNGSLLPDTTNTIKAVLAGSYKLRLSNTTLCVDTSAAIVIGYFSLPTVTITGISGYNLQCTAGSSYQWYDSNMNVIPGATSNTYHPLYSGKYYASVTDANGCKGTSNAFFVRAENILGVRAPSVSIYPSLVHKTLNIDINNDLEYKLTILNALGNIVIIGDVRKQHSLDIQNLQPGMYIIRLTNNDQVILGKFIKLVD